MNTIELDGRKFEYVKPTLTLVKNISKKEYEKIFENLDSALFDEKEYKKFKKRWTEFCKDVFVTDWKWKFGIPKELRLENLQLNKVPEVARGFFDLLLEIRKDIEKQSQTLGGSETQNNTQ